MANIRVRTEKPEDYLVMRSVMHDEEAAKFSERELDAKVRVIEPGSDESLQLFEMDYLPDTEVDIHAHVEDEIIYIVAGEMIVGNRALGPGSTIFVGGNTLYSFKSGPNGMRMLNFRPRADRSFITREEHRQRRGAAG